MFNLIVSGRVSDDRRGQIMASRVFSYTREGVESQFSQGGEIDFSEVVKLPTLLMEEGRGDEVARIAWLKNVVRRGSDYQLDYSTDPDYPNLRNSEIAALLTELDMDDWELGTNHWAIKDVDLFEVLYRKSAGDRPKPTVFQLSGKPVDPKLVSFMMPFDGSFNLVYQDVKTVLESKQYECKRADDMWEHDHIMSDIIELICTSSVVVCDLSTKNPNVFYEAGIAHTLGKQVILITQSSDDVPFDLRPIRFLHYHNNGEGRSKLALEILARVQALA
ncbi:hypothetical protein PXK58_20035 [Phaeobacter gallaeciensis]|uniref:hypothetical protein n=1 Tax=Phaeobacter gallaeciensis TaxID=60890 RepID=UPI002380596A|nr:hypothetical protein [Phaeobacter gallaeciensis]MDE4276608.1 hypothetical protein [Phaeobacter gallaeciensis]MDE4301838.1 hypothetical protein [Phaeobacter gallaeciensis]MDE5187002.1 hypothetical protein [Phaeobacter gallaeciensis]